MRRWLVALGFLAAFAGVAAARPGGGHSFSSSSHSSSSHSSYSSGGHTSYSSSGGGSSGGGGDLIDLLFFFFEYPRIGLPTIVLIVVLIVWLSRRQRRHSWSTAARAEAPPPREPPERRLRKLTATDPDFSTVIFQDFLYALYAAAAEARAGKLERLSPYLSPNAQADLAAIGGTPPPDEVSEVVVGGMTIDAVELADPTVVTVTFTASYTERHGKESVHWAAEETWRLERPQNVKSRPPARARTLDCPNCAAALTEVENGICSHCGQNVGSGAFDWRLTSVTVGSRDRGGAKLDSGGYAEERTVGDTTVAADRQRELAALKTRDPSFTEKALLDRVKVVFTAMQAGWSSRDWKQVRPFLSDSLFQSQLYWIQTYIRRRQKNITENNSVTNLVIVKVSSDRWYDAITVRMWANGLDYTITDDGKLIGGSRSKKRAYSEYWTFIRSHERTKPTEGSAAVNSSNTNCPNCGAELKINMAGTCEYCQAKVTSGEFDWVLSRIEQDEVYQG